MMKNNCTTQSYLFSNRLLLFVFAAILITSFSCSKDDEVKKINLETAILGTWKLQKVHTTATNQKLIERFERTNKLIADGTIDIYDVEYKKDKKYIHTYREKGREARVYTGTWKITDKEMTITESDGIVQKVSITKFNNKVMVFDLKQKVFDNDPTLYPVSQTYERK